MKKMELLKKTQNWECPVCGRVFVNAVVWRHLQRKHPEELKEIHKIVFDMEAYDMKCKDCGNETEETELEMFDGRCLSCNIDVMAEKELD